MLGKSKDRGRLVIKIDALQRMVMWHVLSDKMPLYLVTEYPKSGGSWVAQMLSEYLKVPYPRDRRPPLRSCILQGHHLYSPHFHNVFCVMRDGRDVMVSYYYHRLFQHDRNPSWFVARERKRITFKDYENIRNNLPAFIEYIFRTAERGFKRFTWAEFVSSWINRDVPIIRYERLLEDGPRTLYEAIARVSGELPSMKRLRDITEAYSFERQAGRRPGEEDTRSFLRKGVAGDWKKHFSRKACEIFDHYAGEALIEAGYERNRDWLAEIE